MFLYKAPFGPLATHAILVGCLKTRKAAAIDPALGSQEALLRAAKGEGLHIEKILLTHSHWDHFADASALKKATGALVCAHPLDAKNLKEPGSDGIPLFFPIEPVAVDHFFSDGERIEVGELAFEVIHTPGHSPGSVSFYLAQEGTLFSGDTLFQGGMGNLQLPTARPKEMWHSLRKLSRLPPNTRVIPGHGPTTTIEKESWIAQDSR